MIDTLLFDLDNTLLDFDKAEAHALTKALDDARISVTDEMLGRYNKINLTQWKLLEQGKMTRDEVKIRRFKLLFQEFHIKVSPEKVASNYQIYLGQGHYFIEGIQNICGNKWNVICTDRKIKKFRNQKISARYFYFRRNWL